MLRSGLSIAFLSMFALAPCAAQTVSVPGFWDPQHRVEKPDLPATRVLRFSTEDDYPPFDFAMPDGTLAGFNVDLARALCEELRVICTVQPRRWDTILPSVEQGQTDAAVASLAMTPENRKRVDFTVPYYRTPARFVMRASVGLTDITAQNMTGRTVGVEAHTAHEAYLRSFFPGAAVRVYENGGALLSALKRREVDIIFGDGVTLAVWLNGTDAASCCAFAGGAYTESRYFGDGVGIAVRKGNVALQRGLNYALQRLAERGVYADLYLKYFPLSFY